MTAPAFIATSACPVRAASRCSTRSTSARFGWSSSTRRGPGKIPVRSTPAGSNGSMHHPPLATGIPVWDELGLPPADRRAFGEVVTRHAQVQRLVAGHVHRTMSGSLAGRPVLTAPSTYVQARLNFAAQELELAEEPAGFVLHAVADGEVISHMQPVH
jgi:hypothetical protein